MKLKINYFKTTKSIKELFNEAYPYLKLEFFTTAHSTGEATSNTQRVRDDTPLGEINPLLKEGIITINPVDTVAALEQTFQQKFGLPVQVFRKQKDVWIETTKTDQLSLFHQNNMGKEASAPVMQEIPGDRYLEDGQY